MSWFDHNAEKKWQAVELLALADMEYREIADVIGVTSKTLFEWRRNPEFAAEVRKRALDLLKEKLPPIYRVISEKSLEGDLAAIRLLLERVDRAEDDVAKATTEGSITFTWGKKGTNDETTNEESLQEDIEAIRDKF